MKETTAILVVNGGRDPAGRRWIDCCIDNIAAFTDPASYRLYVWDNNAADRQAAAALQGRVGPRYWQPAAGEVLEHFHAVPLQRLYEAARADGMRRFVVMDSDAHPVRADWLQILGKALDDGAVLAGVWRDELEPSIPGYVHASCLAVDAAFIDQHGLRFDSVCRPEATGARDTLFDFTSKALSSGQRMHRLNRSNRHNFHRLIGGLYGDLVYHHGAGSRENILFWGEQDTSSNRLRNTLLGRISASLLMSDPENYLAWLRGEPVSAAFMARARWLVRLSEKPASPASRAFLVRELVMRFLRSRLAREDGS